MYVPSAFREDRPEVLRALIAAHPLATLATHGPGGLAATLAPFVLARAGDADVLRTHLARGNDQLEALGVAHEALAVFQGPQAYITPSWYPSKREHGRVVPTWNYVVVQVWGRPRLVEDADWLHAQVVALTEQQERGRPQPWAVSDAPPSFVAAQLRGIVGLELTIERIQGKWKASQNQPQANREGVCAGLREAGPAAMADLIEARAGAG